MLLAFAKKHPESRGPLEAWYAEAKRARWNSMKDIKERFGTASILNNERVVFNIHGNDYRLVAFIRFKTRLLFIRFIGTHHDYDTIDATGI